LIPLFAEGKTVRQAAKVLKAEGFPKASVAIVGRDLQALAREAPQKVEEARQEAGEQLRGLRQLINNAEELGLKDQVGLLLQVHDRYARLLGLDAPTKSVSATFNGDVDPATLIGYRKFVSVTSNMDQATLSRVYEFAAKLNGAPAPRVINPPATSELWEDEPKQLTEGQ
jgi:hypothetical protein